VRQVKHVRHGDTETGLGHYGKAAINRPYDQSGTLVSSLKRNPGIAACFLKMQFVWLQSMERIGR
jgi:hypothetical protein